jgi:hypothetical protein
LETHLLFADYEIAFDRPKDRHYLNILKSRNIPDPLLKAIVGIYTQKKLGNCSV